MFNNFKIMFNVQIEISRDEIENILINAFYSGIGQWAEVKKVNKPKDVEIACWEVSPISGGSILIYDFHEKKIYNLNLKKIEKGLKVMSQKFPKHFADFLSGNDDAITADVFIQCCLFQDIIYG